MGKGSNVTIGYKYYLGMQMGLCRGQIDTLYEIRVGDRTAWSGNLSANTQFRIEAPELFGGTKAEGGVQGDCWLMLGNSTMTVPSQIVTWLGGLVPGFRGVTTLFFDGMICAMNPYPKPWKMKAARVKQGWDQGLWYSAKAQIDLAVTDREGNPLTIVAMNPAHVIYQCCTDRSWGRGMPVSLMNDAAFRQAADTLFDEGLGLCLAWKRQDTIDSFVQTLLDHMGGVVYVDKATGLFTLKLIRQDYVKSQLPLFDVDSGLLSIEESSVSAGTEILNEIVVNWHDPITNQDSAVREQNLAAIQANGALCSKTNDYPGLPTPELAQRIAKRDLAYSSLPLRRFQITCDRRAWHVQPGDVLRIQDPTRAQSDIVIRIGAVNDGTLTDGRVRIAAVEDVFIMPLTASVGVQDPLWVPPNDQPAVGRRRAYEIPYVNLNRIFPKGEFLAIGFDAGYYGMAAEKPSQMSVAYDLALRPNGGEWAIDGRGDFVPLGELGANISYLDTTLTLVAGVQLDEVNLPCAVLLGEEVVMVTAMTLGATVFEATLTLDRGIYDTVPAKHFIGDLIWFYEESVGSNWVEYVGGDLVEGKVLSWTFSGGRLTLAGAPIDPVTMNWRFSRPYAPGHALMNSARWYLPQVMNQDQPSLLVSWTHRDRIAQGDSMIPHDTGNIGPEPGTTYTIKVYDEFGAIIRTEIGLTGTSWTYLWSQAMSDLGLDPNNTNVDKAIVLRLWSHRDDLDSWQYYEMNVNVQDFEMMMMAAQFSEQSVQTSTLSDPNGVMVAQYGQTVEQQSTLPEPIDYQVTEIPYINLLHDGLPPIHSRTITLAARPSSRLTDGHDLWTAALDADGALEIEPYYDSGAQPWTPWVLSGTDLAHLSTDLPYSQSSLNDGVPLNFQPGDLAIIDKEIIRIDGVASGALTISRGVADTIPSRHRAGSVVWLYDRAHGLEDKTREDEQWVGVKIQPHVHTALPVALEEIARRSIQMAYRYDRPYPPGLVLVDGSHWFAPHNAFTVDAQGNKIGKNVLFTWKHRDRIWQGETPVDHWADNIGPESGTTYQIKVCYNTKARPGVPATKVVLREFEVSGNSWIYKGEWAEADGISAGNALQVCGSVSVFVQLFSVREGRRSWQGYITYLSLPAYACPAGQQPGGGAPVDGPSGGGDTGGNDSGGSGPGGSDAPNNPDPTNPYNPDPEPPPDPPPGPDPDDPVLEPPPDEPVEPPPPDEDFSGSWGIDWDHDWARDLPPEI